MLKKLVTSWWGHAFTLGIALVAVVTFATTAVGHDGSSRVNAAGGATAPTYTLRAPGIGTFTFGQLTNINSEIDPPAAITLAPSGGVAHQRQYGSIRPPSMTLTRALGAGVTGTQIFKWHQMALEGSPAAKVTSTLTVRDPVTGNVVVVYTLINAWVSKISLAGAKAGSSAVQTLVVTLGADMVEINQPTG